MEPRAPPLQGQLQRSISAPNNTTVLNKYQLGRLLGRGSFAKVYAGRALTDNKIVAVKIIDKARTDAAMEPRIISEISAMRRLQYHPNILGIHEVMATKTRIYLVMELASGGDLFTNVLQRGKMKEPTARRYFQQLVSALSFCHQNGVAHRDVKPHNILLDEKGNLKVSDFGLSALAEAKSVNGMLHTACGTPGFTAPEVMSRRDGGYDGSKADAWSCGVILFFLLTATLPFDDRSIANMFKRIYRKDYQIPPWVSKPVKMSIEGIMKHSWFTKKFESPSQRSALELDETKMCRPYANVNAFDLISLSSGLNLSGLFEVVNRKDKRFTSSQTVERVMDRVREVGGRSGYRVVEGKGGAIGLGKGRLSLVFEVLEIAERLLLVEMKVVEGGLMEFEETHWGELKDGLEDVVLQWHNDAI
ncbi:hypothetical protein K2173_006470 [Erythroxylum novogranatense]|uniref:non-specific serine/threonine protein kinase n=1 Tax=Erythroxylum novogranatense TaxID=1862640 RepID=A0AAV8TEV2_9ROSI|nr:hypothetical protein K2173_006470 [Erythroxylum novogranatense]